MSGGISVGQRLEARSGFTGFDYLRVGLSVLILLWHCYWVFMGHYAWDTALFSGFGRFFPASFVPLFFALSGFLVAGSLERNTLRHFLLLRVLRILPALSFEVLISACLIGLAFTSMDRLDYLQNPRFHAYFLNIIGLVHIDLPAVFVTNPLPEQMNPQLWTIPYEFECYLALAALSLLGLVWKRWFLGLTVLSYVTVFTAWTAYRITLNPQLMHMEGHVPGRVLVAAFLAGVALYRYRHAIPYSTLGGVLSIIGLVVTFDVPQLVYLSALPAAYFVVWVGMMTPPPIPFGDLSYGIYLFHFPITQLMMHLFPVLTVWWQLALIALPASAGCALVSWTLIEKPLLSHKRAIITRFDGAVAAVAALAGRRKAPRG